MPATRFVNDSAYDPSAIPDVSGLREWIPLAAKALSRRIAIDEFSFKKSSLFGKRKKLYSVLLDLGYGQAQILNFAARDGSDWSINPYVPSQEVAAWAMGVVAGHEAPLPSNSPLLKRAAGWESGDHASDCLIRDLAAALRSTEALVISGFYEDRVPIFEQGMPHHELQCVVTAAEVTAYVNKIEELKNEHR